MGVVLAMLRVSSRGGSGRVRLSGVLLQGIAASLDDTSGRLSKIQADTLVVYGQHDRLVPPGNAWQLHAGVPTSTLAIVRDAGHFFAFEDPESAGRSCCNGSARRTPRRVVEVRGRDSLSRCSAPPRRPWRRSGQHQKPPAWPHLARPCIIPALREHVTLALKPRIDSPRFAASERRTVTSVCRAARRRPDPNIQAHFEPAIRLARLAGLRLLGLLD